MNTRQRLILFAAAVIIAGMMLFPPFHQTPDFTGRGQHIDYGFLLGSTKGRVEVGLLLTQFLAAAAVGEHCEDQL